MRFRVLAIAVAGLVLLAGVRLLVADRQGEEPVAATPTPDVIEALPRSSTELDEQELRGLRFEDVTAEAGLTSTPTRSDQPTALASMTAGAAVTHRAGRLTLLLTSELDPVRLVELRGDRFVDVTRRAGLARAGAGTAALFADLDGDGDDDLVLGHQGPKVLTVWRNEGGRFAEDTAAFGITSKAGLPESAADPAVRGIAAADVDGDGRLDLVVADVNPTLAALGRYGEGVGADEGDAAACEFADQLEQNAPQFPTSRTRLYLGGSDGRFTDATSRWGLPGDTTFANTPQLVDVNDDGRVDLLLTGASCTSRVLLNDAGRRFVSQESASARIPQANGAVVRDLDGDGTPDWLVTGVAYPTRDGDCPAITIVTGCRGNALLLGGGDGSFDDADAADLSDAGWGFGVAAEDFANTGDLQVAVTNGFTAADGEPDGARSQWSTYFARFAADPMAFFVRGEDGDLVDVARQVGLDDTAAGRALMALDYDGDGRLDLLANTADAGPRLFRNVTPQQDRHWVRIALRDGRTATNRAGWGARVQVTSDAGSTDCWITSNTSYETASTGQCHVGLGADAGPVRVRVWWPGATEPQEWSRVPVDRLTVLER